MKFKKLSRTLYKTNILYQVIFQARFPQILKISNEEPANFQDIIRKKGFPETQIIRPDLPAYLPDPFKKAIDGEAQYFFLSEEGDYKTTLTKDFIALSCTQYTDFREFKKRLRTVLEVFEKMYQPNSYTRIGLRYQNIANKKVLGEKCKDVREFIPEIIAPELKSSIGEEVTGFEKMIQLTDKQCNTNVRYLLGKHSGTFGKYKINNEESYIIDIDCFTEEKVRNVTDVLKRATVFNELYVRNIFHAATTPTLLKAMEPIR
jgi:uncharacterized protein (TIGR04255 family)